MSAYQEWPPSVVDIASVDPLALWRLLDGCVFDVGALYSSLWIELVCMLARRTTVLIFAPVVSLLVFLSGDTLLHSLSDGI